MLQATQSRKVAVGRGLYNCPMRRSTRVYRPREVRRRLRRPNETIDMAVCGVEFASGAAGGPVPVHGDAD